MDMLPRFTALRALPLEGIVAVFDQVRFPSRRCTENILCRLDEVPGALACGFGCACVKDEASQLSELGVCCRPGRVACRGECRDPCPVNQAIDPATCLCACLTTPCPPPKVRNASTCVCECPPPWTDCNGVCRNLSTSSTNCGNCGNVCNQGEACCNGNCTTLDTCANCGFCGNACAADEGCCNRVRKKLNTTLNCGSYDGKCGMACAPGEVCQSGQCVCPAGRVRCAGICCPTGQQCCDGVCVNTHTSKQHCGACNMPVPQGWDCCNGQAVDTRSDNYHCGACGKAISAEQTALGYKCCGGVPVNTMGNDVRHCGGCGLTCTGGISCPTAGGGACSNYVAACQDGQCVCPSGWYACGTNWCAPNTFPVCCGDDPVTGLAKACPAGTTCCASGCC